MENITSLRRSANKIKLCFFHITNFLAVAIQTTLTDIIYHDPDDIVITNDNSSTTIYLDIDCSIHDTRNFTGADFY